MTTKKEMAEELERLRAQIEEYEDEEEPSPDPNGYYVPTHIHLAMPPEEGLGSIENFKYYCSFDKEGSWEAEWLDDKKARTLPVCPECILLWETANGMKWEDRKKVRKPKPQPKPEIRVKVPDSPNKWLYEPGLTLSSVPNP